MSRNRLKNFTYVLAALAATLVVLPSASVAAKGPKVGIKGDQVGKYQFTPQRLEVRPGTTVRWSWDSNSPHNVAFLPKIDSQTGNSGSYRRKFKKPGTYQYICTIHEFTGKIIVKGK